MYWTQEATINYSTTMASPPSPSGSIGTKGKPTRRGSSWSPSFPYFTDYNDHFETPRRAYLDVKPLLDWLIDCLTDIDSDTSCTKTTAAMYDPYYCNGRTAVLLRDLGYDNVIHEKRDFYADMGKFYDYDILITNPPYSDTHKKRCLAYCLEQLRNDPKNQRQRTMSGNIGEATSVAKTTTTRRQGKPFLLLMPAYTASKQYYRDCLNLTSLNEEEDIVYLVPSAPYHYEHPEKTGKDQSPFDSLWFCGIGKDRVAAFQRFWESLPRTNHRPRLATSLAELQKMNVISFQNRPNPRKRGKKRKQMMMMMQPVPAKAAATTTMTAVAKGPSSNVLSSASNPSKAKRASDTTSTVSIPASSSSVPPENEKKSKYRDQSGQRSKKRF